jgi:CubicO group peptidase (beta-lactamase class C family)
MHFGRLTAAAALGALAIAAACAQTQLPGVPFAAAQRTAFESANSKIIVSGTGTNKRLDALVTAFMKQRSVPNAELAVSSGGKAIFSHAYTNLALTKSVITTSTIMRLASNSKAWTSAALYNLIAAKKIKPAQKVFQYLGITHPLPAGAGVDPRVYTITIADMIAHESGWDDRVPPYYDPTFHMRQTALALGLKHEIDQTQEVRYQLHQPLQEKPGTHYAYCNFCYTVLGMVVAKASKMSYEAYLQHAVAPAIGVRNVFLSPTVGKRLPDEVAKYFNPYTGLSAVYVTSNRQWPYPYGGDDMVLEVAQGASSVATNAASMVALMAHYIIWGVGTPPPAGYDWCREGEMPGTNTWAEQLPNGVHYAVLVNTNAYLYGKDPNAFLGLQYSIERALGAPTTCATSGP